MIQINRVGSNREATKELLENELKLSVPTHVRSTLWNLADGILSPLEGFMGREDYLHVINEMRLANGTPWTIPILLHAPEDFQIAENDEVTLVDETDGAPLALFSFDEEFKIVKEEHAMKVFGTKDVNHPGVARIFDSHERIFGGRVKLVVKKQTKFDSYALTPKDTRQIFEKRGWKKILAFQTRNAPHIGHEYVQKIGLALADGLFINPVLGKKKPGDFKDEVILSTYQTLVKNYYPADSVVLGVLHYEMQYGGPKEAIMHAIMRKNFGCTHIAIGRDHAGVGSYYPPYAAHEIFNTIRDLGIEAILMREFYYCKSCYEIASEKICPHPESDRVTFSGTKLRNMFITRETPPKEFMRPEVSELIMGSKKPFVEQEEKTSDSFSLIPATS